MNYRLIIALILFSNVMGSLNAQLKDRDGNNYQVVRIGKQEWMAENLDVAHFSNGDTIPEAQSAAEWEKAGMEGKPAWCYYNGDTALGRKYHKLYNWFAIHDPRGLAPRGWRIPAREEWGKLSTLLGNENVAATKMKSNSLWNGTNESGFNALAAGYRNKNWEFTHWGNLTSWWSSTEVDDRNAWSCSVGNGSVLSRSYDNKMVGLSVRCIRE